MSLLNILKKSPIDFEIPERKINPLYILDEERRAEYIKYGFTIFRNVVKDEIIDEMLQTHEKISKMDGYFDSKSLETTIAFGPEIHTIVIDKVKEISNEVFKGILDPNLCKYDFGGGIIIKNKGCKFAPHHDCSIVDEYTGTTSYAWMPTEDMTDDNGTFYAIIGSHLWSAWQRSSQYPTWPLKKFNKFLWSQMEPVYSNKGDIVLFDSALIHASKANKTNKKRLAFNSCVIEKTAKFVQYYYDKDTPQGKVEKYLVDLKYWYAGKLNGRPEGYERVIEDTVYPSYFDEKFLKHQIEKYRPND